MRWPQRSPGRLREGIAREDPGATSLSPFIRIPVLAIVETTNFPSRLSPGLLRAAEEETLELEDRLGERLFSRTARR